MIGSFCGYAGRSVFAENIPAGTIASPLEDDEAVKASRGTNARFGGFTPAATALRPFSPKGCGAKRRASSFSKPSGGNDSLLFGERFGLGVIDGDAGPAKKGAMR